MVISTASGLIAAAVISAAAAAVRSGVGMKKAPAVRVDHHRSVESPHRAIFRIGGLELIKLLSRFSDVSQSCLLVEKLIDAKSHRK
jgi:hypothetical protein